MIGFGTYKLTKDEAYNMTIKALNMGYRVIDTAELYNNEKQVAKAIEDSGIERNEIFLTTKVSTKDETKIEKSFSKRIRIFPKIDLLLLHWPSRDPIKGWRNMIKMWEQHNDQVSNIGISNVSLETLKQIIEATGVKPYAVQNEINPFCYDITFEGYCKDNGIKLIAHSCFSYGTALEIEEVKTVAQMRQITPATLLLQWVKQHSDIYLTRCNGDQYLKENYDTSGNHNFKDIRIDTDKQIRLYFNK